MCSALISTEHAPLCTKQELLGPVRGYSHRAGCVCGSDWGWRLALWNRRDALLLFGVIVGIDRNEENLLEHLRKSYVEALNQGVSAGGRER